MNKVFALAQVEAHSRKCVFLDTDQVCVGDISRHPCLCAGISVRVVGWSGAVHSYEAIENLYEIAGVTLPSDRLFMFAPDDSGCGLSIPFEANTSFIAVDSYDSQRLGQRWIQMFEMADRYPQLFASGKRHFQEQLTFMLSVRSLGLPVLFVRECDQPLVHYHKPEWLQKSNALKPLLRDVIREHGEIREISKGNPVWERALDEFAK